MKTTIELPDVLIDELREAAVAERTTMRALIERAIRTLLDSRRASRTSFILQDASVEGRGLSTEFQTAGWDQIRDAAYGA